jgi:neutral/alkaline ceramidase-like enzyme
MRITISRGASWRAAYLIMAGLICAVSGSAAWQAGVARVDITPSQPIWMGGYAARTHPSEGIRQHIFAKALALKDDTGAVTVLVTSDLLGFPGEVSGPIFARVQQKFGLSRERIALNSSHTHSAPVVGHMLSPAYPLTDADMNVVEAYTAHLQDQIVELIGKSIHDLAPAELSFEQGFAGVAVNRRRVGHREYPGPVEQDVPVLAVLAPDHHLLAIVFGYACHNTVLSDYQINGDWAGYAQASLEKSYPGAVAMFVQDCGADANPMPRHTVELAVNYGETIAAAVDQVLRAKMRTVEGPLTVAFVSVDLPFQKPPSREEFESRSHAKDALLRRHAALMLRILDRDGKLPDHRSYPIEVWQFGKDLTFIALGGEVVVDYSLRFKHEYGFDKLWVAGYTNDVFAYIPSRRVLAEGGYEGGGAMIAYGQPAPFTPDVEEIVARGVASLVARVQQR